MQTQGAAIDYLRRNFGGDFRPVESTVAVVTTSGPLIGFDSERVFLVIVNVGAVQAFIGPSPEVSLTRGIRVGPQGGIVGFFVEQDAIMACHDLYAIADVGGTTLYTLAVRREAAIGKESEA